VTIDRGGGDRWTGVEICNRLALLEGLFPKDPAREFHDVCVSVSRSTDSFAGLAQPHMVGFSWPSHTMLADRSGMSWVPAHSRSQVVSYS